jgi:hypothetical protein
MHWPLPTGAAQPVGCCFSAQRLSRLMRLVRLVCWLRLALVCTLRLALRVVRRASCRRLLQRKLRGQRRQRGIQARGARLRLRNKWV